jgi:hypothetical protein
MQVETPQQKKERLTSEAHEGQRFNGEKIDVLYKSRAFIDIPSIIVLYSSQVLLQQAPASKKPFPTQLYVRLSPDGLSPC